MDPAAYRTMTSVMNRKFSRAPPPPLPEEHTSSQLDEQSQAEGSWVYNTHIATHINPERSKPVGAAGSQAQENQQILPKSNVHGSTSIGMPWMSVTQQQPLMWDVESMGNENEE